MAKICSCFAYREIDHRCNVDCAYCGQIGLDVDHCLAQRLYYLQFIHLVIACEAVQQYFGYGSRTEGDYEFARGYASGFERAIWNVGAISSDHAWYL